MRRRFQDLYGSPITTPVDDDSSTTKSFKEDVRSPYFAALPHPLIPVVYWAGTQYASQVPGSIWIPDNNARGRRLVHDKLIPGRRPFPLFRSPPPSRHSRSLLGGNPVCVAGQDLHGSPITTLGDDDSSTTKSFREDVHSPYFAALPHPVIPVVC